jgi:hypothetical protein
VASTTVIVHVPLASDVPTTSETVLTCPVANVAVLATVSRISPEPLFAAPVMTNAALESVPSKSDVVDG